MLASAGADGSVIVWNTVTGKEIFRRQDKTKSPLSTTISAEAKLVAVGDDDGTMYLYDLASGNIVQRIAADQKARISAAAFSPDGRWLAWGGAS